MRRNLVRLAVAIAAIAAPLALLVPAAHATGGCNIGDGASGSAQALDSILDGWANRDVDIGAFGSAMAAGIGSRVDGWANRDVDISGFGFADRCNS